MHTAKLKVQHKPGQRVSINHAVGGDRADELIFPQKQTDRGPSPTKQYCPKYSPATNLVGTHTDKVSTTQSGLVDEPSPMFSLAKSSNTYPKLPSSSNTKGSTMSNSIIIEQL